MIAAPSTPEPQVQPDGRALHGQNTDGFGNRLFRLTAQLRVSYDVVGVPGLFDPGNGSLASYVGEGKAYCLVDRGIHRVHWPSCERYLSEHGIDYEYLVFDPSEERKTMSSVEAVASHFVSGGMRRRDVLVSIGGGITCDIGGLAANLIRRGTPSVKIPTSLMAVVDAAIGVKTGVNFEKSKNLLGTYYPPRAVLYDLALLRTLPARQIRNGLVEIIKIVALKDVLTFAALERSLDAFFAFPYGPAVREIIEASIAHMLEELERNLFEWNLRRIVDYGHEFGHPIEVLTCHELQHGEAVGIGMLLSNFIAVRRGILDPQDASRFAALYRRLDVPVYDHRLDVASLRTALQSARKHKNGALDLVVLRRIGLPDFLDEIGEDDLRYGIEALRSTEAERVRLPEPERLPVQGAVPILGERS